MKYEITKYEDRDHMPREVALELLTTPRTKLSARMRKNCMQARENVTSSAHPIRWAAKNEDEFVLMSRETVVFYDDRDFVQAPWYALKKNLVRVADVDHTPKPMQAHMAALCRRLPFGRVVRLIKRCTTRIARIESAKRGAMRKLKVPYILQALIADFNKRLDALNTMRDIARNEIECRKI